MHEELRKNIYLIPGLGADKRLFVNLDLPDYNVHHIEWIPPTDNESIEEYAARLLQQIKTPDPVIIGVSFGGLMAIEIGKLINTEKIILISSARTSSEIPFYFKISGRLGLSKLIGSISFHSVNAMTCWFFGIKTEEERKLLSSIITDTDPKFIEWAMEKIVKWKNSVLLKNVTLIHGTSDKLFTFSKADHKIKGGEHFMIYNRAAEISALFGSILND